MLKKCDTRQTFKIDSKEKPLYILSNSNISCRDFLKILNKRLSKNKNRIIKKIINQLLVDSFISRKNFSKQEGIYNKNIGISIKKFLNRFSNLKPYIYVDNETIKLKEYNG